MYTIWGQTDRVTKLADGIIDVGTPSHGGIMVTELVANERLTEAARKVGERSVGYLCYEEDCNWAIVAWELNDVRAALEEKVTVNPIDITDLYRTVCFWNCDYARERGYFAKNMTDEQIRASLRG